jgi:hypothetical protein
LTCSEAQPDVTTRYAITPFAVPPRDRSGEALHLALQGVCDTACVPACPVDAIVHDAVLTPDDPDRRHDAAWFGRR